MSGNINFNGWLNDDGSENYKCRAWVNLNGTGTVAIRASGNVSTITDNGPGDYTVNFTTAMPDANYACVSMGVIDESSGSGNRSVGLRSTTGGESGYSSLLTTSCRVLQQKSNNTEADSDVISIAIFR